MEDVVGDGKDGLTGAPCCVSRVQTMWGLSQIFLYA